MISADSLETIVRRCLIPQHRHGHSSGVVGFGRGVDLVKEFCVVHRIRSLGVNKCPAEFAHEPVDDGYRDHVLKTLQGAEDERTMCPWAGVGDIQVITSGFGLEAGRAVWPRRAVRGDPVPEFSVRADESALVDRLVVVAIVPLSVDQKSHNRSSFATITAGNDSRGIAARKSGCTIGGASNRPSGLGRAGVPDTIPHDGGFCRVVQEVGTTSVAQIDHSCIERV